MEGIKEFTNNSCTDVNVILTVRSGERVGCVAGREEFCLKRFERKCITYGNACNPCLDKIQVCPVANFPCTETCVCVCKIGDPIDRLLNRNYNITFLSAGECLVITNYRC